MRCEIQIDPAVQEPYAVIVAGEATPEVLTVAQLLQRAEEPVLRGYAEKEIRLLRQPQILRIYTQRQKVWAQTLDGRQYALRERLYELEGRLDTALFVRISNAEIINSNCICSLDVSLTGTIGVYLEGGIKTYASRRYVPRLKQFFGL